MAQRFSNDEDIEWINFDPKTYKGKPSSQKQRKNQVEIPKLSKEFIMLAATASYLQEEIEEEKDPWENSPFEWILKLPRQKKRKTWRRSNCILACKQRRTNRIR